MKTDLNLVTTANKAARDADYVAQLEADLMMSHCARLELLTALDKLETLKDGAVIIALLFGALCGGLTVWLGGLL